MRIFSNKMLFIKMGKDMTHHSNLLTPILDDGPASPSEQFSITLGWSGSNLGHGWR
jgi:hypothetical protein